MLMPSGVKAWALVLLICVLAAGQVWLSHLRVETAQVHVSLKIERDILLKAVQGLRLELTSLVRPDTLRRLAREQLGMNSPRPSQVIQP